MDEPRGERWVAPGGWRRVAIGLALGAGIGAVLSRVLRSGRAGPGSGSGAG